MADPLRLERFLIRVSGRDAIAFLNNLLTQDLAPLTAAGVLYAALLSPQGKVTADMLVWADGPDVVLETDPVRGGDLLRRLSMYKLRAAVEVKHAEDYAVIWAREPFAGASPDPRAAALGWRKIVSRAEAADLADGANAFEAARLAFGAPDLARDAGPEEVFALEALLEELNGVAFQKGCFIGQENVSRMKRRATTRKKFCALAFEGAPPAFGATLTAGNAEVGAVRGGGDGRALGLIRLDRALEALEGGAALEAEGRAIRLDPQRWLILPQREAPPPGGRD